MNSLTLPGRLVEAKRTALLPAVLVLGFGAALILRLLIGGFSVASSQPAALVFAGCLIAITLAARAKIGLSQRSIGIGILGGLFLCLPAALIHFENGHLSLPRSSGYLSWAVVATTVALAEEAFFRGVLFDALNKWRGEKPAIILPALAFAALHVPLYGWHSAPLDLAVGVWLGVLRLVSGSFVAPGVAHVIADLVGWWL